MTNPFKKNNVIIRSMAFGLVLALGTSPVFAAAIITGQTLAPISITNKGECILDGSDTRFVPWDSENMAGKVQVFHYLAARAGVDKIHAPFIEAIKSAGFPEDQLEITTVVNSDDALWGTSGLVAPEIEKQKLKTPKESFVVDAEGIGQQQWQLKRKNSAIAIIDQSGTVVFFKEGVMNESEFSPRIAQIRELLE